MVGGKSKHTNEQENDNKLGIGKILNSGIKGKGK